MRPKLQRAAALMAKGASTREMAEALGVSRATAWRYTREPEVLADVLEIQAASRRRAKGRLLSLAEEAVDVLGKVLRDEEAPLRVRLTAAIAVLDRLGFSPALAAQEAEGDERPSEIVVSFDGLPRPPAGG